MAASDDLQELVHRCIDRFESEGEAALEDLCRDHPDQATALRRRISHLQQMGLLGSSPTESIPDQMGQYKLLQRIGGGGMGVVYLAEDQELGRQVALKLVRPDNLYFPGTRERFRREVEVVARLQHPAIVPVFAVGEENGVPYFAMERVHGCTLEEVIRHVSGTGPGDLTGADLADAVLQAIGSRRREAQSEADTASGYLFAGSWEETCLRIARTIAEALEHAHRRGVVHRDLKPSNIMLTPTGRVLLLDFGLASSEEAQRFTRSGGQYGSLPYMSPEQADGEFSGLDPRSDVYSLATTLYELLTLRRAIVGGAAHEVIRNITAGDIRPPREVNSTISWETETVCLTALDRDRNRRYESAADFARDLGNILDRRPIEARRAGVWLRVRRWTERNPALAVGLVLGSLLFVGGPTAFAIQQRTANQFAQKQKTIADTGFQSALDAIDRMLTRVSTQDLQAIPQMESVRAQLLEDAIALYEVLARVQGDDRQLQLQRLAAERRLGRLLIDLGDVARAESITARVVEELRALFAARAEELDAQRQLGLGLITLGVAQLKGGKLDESIATHEATEAIFAALSEREPHQLDHQLQLGLTLTHLGDAQFALGRPQPGQEAFERGIDKLEEVHAAISIDHENRSQVVNALIRSYTTLGYRLLGDERTIDDERPETERVLIRAIELCELVTSGTNHAPSALLNEVVARNNLAGLYRRQSRLEFAENTYRAAFDPLQRLVADFPDTFKYGHQLATAENNLALVCDLQGKIDESSRYYAACIERLHRLVERNPRVVQLRQDLGIAERNLGFRFRNSGKLTEAVPHLQRACEQKRRAIELSVDPVNRRHLAEDEATLAELHCELGDHAAAQEALRRSADAWPDSWESYSLALDSTDWCIGFLRRRARLPDQRKDDLAEEYTLLGIELVDLALDHDLEPPEALVTADDFAWLREQPDFQAYLDELGL